MSNMNSPEKDREIILGEIQSKEGIVHSALQTVKKGGFRPGSGRPRGSKNKLTKEGKVQEVKIKERIIKNLDDLLNSQLSLAKGLSYLYKIRMRNVGGKRKPEHIRVTDPKEIKAFLDGDAEDEYYYITTKTPDNKAIDSLIDRALGKATTESSTDHSITYNIINYEKKQEIGGGTFVETSPGGDTTPGDDNSALQLHS